jgi:SET domain-containing protein
MDTEYLEPRSVLVAGPVRFENHDCHPNAKLWYDGQYGVQICAIGDIRPGDEITVSLTP